ncbi:MAG TPA: isoprenylcysteine carboxylmethyltransferase family protein [Thermoanaerobaculia bacterium]
MSNDRPGVIAPPPLIFVAAFAIGYLFRNLMPRVGSPVAGAAVAAVGVIILGLAFNRMLRAGTSIDPSKPTTALVTSGIYRFSRNPIYVATTLLYVAAALSFRVLPALILLPVALVVLHFGVIKREERYLESKFGEEYRNYRAKVRRWI